MKEVRGLLVIHLPSNIFHHTSSDCTGGRIAMQFDTASQNIYFIRYVRKHSIAF
jgi:hypothetical protein